MENRKVVRPLIITVGVIVMIVSLSGQRWLTGKVDGNKSNAGLISFEYCTKKSDVADDGSFVWRMVCSDQSWSYLRNQGRASFIFTGSGACVLCFSVFSIACFVLFAVLCFLGFHVEKASFHEELNSGFFEIDDKTIRTKFHPVRMAVKVGILACLEGAVFIYTAPEGFSAGYGLSALVVGFIISSCGTYKQV